MSSAELNALSLALEAGGAAFASMANALPHFVWTAAPDGTVEFFNDRWIDYTAQTVEQSRGAGYKGVVHSDDIALMWERWNQAVQTNTPFEMEYRLRRARDGTFRWFIARALPMRDSAGTVRMWVGTATDIDAQKRANENLNFVLQASSLFASAATPQEISNEFARLAVQRFADWCVVVLTDELGRHTVASLEHRDPQKLREVWSYVERYPIADDQNLTDLLERNQPVLYSEITDEMLVKSARDEEHLRLLRSLGMHSAIVMPLHAEGAVLGGVILYTAESGRAFGKPDLDVVGMLAERAAAAIAGRRLMSREQRAKQRLQFIGRATQAVYESLDLSATFAELAQLIVSTFADFAAIARIERGECVRVLAAAHRDPAKSDVAGALVGVRPFHPDAEKKFIAGLKGHKTIARSLRPGVAERSTWPYLAYEIAALDAAFSVTIPLHSRGTTYGAIVAYSSDRTRNFTAEEIEILAEVGRHASVAMENAEVFDRERRIAQTLQESLLPPSVPSLQGLRFNAVYLPSATGEQVGGDWYDAFALEDGSVVISVGDVTGRGTDAAVIMGKVRHLIAIAPSYERDPARILDTVETVLARRYPEAIVTAFLGIIDPGRTTLRYGNAGHPHPLLRRSRQVEELRADGLPLGLRSRGEPAQAVQADLGGARMLVLYTDGLVEATRDVLAGYRRLREVVQTQALLHTHDPARFIEESCLTDRSDDDVAVLTVSFEPSVRWTFDAENARAAQDSRGQFVRYLLERGSEKAQVGIAELIFGELVGNVVRHSPGPIDIDLDWVADFPTLHVIDRGSPFELTEGLPGDPLSESGRGLFIVRRLARDVHVEHVAGYGNHVTVELPVRRNPDKLVEGAEI